MSYRTCLFDLDGTLVDSLADLATAVNALRGELDLAPLDLETVRGHVGDGAGMLVRRSLPEGLFAEGRLRRFMELYGACLTEQTRLYPGMADLLAALAGRSLAVVTNKPLRLTEQLLDALDLTRAFPVVIGGDSCPVKKPSPVPVQLALHRLGVTAAQAVMIGDHHTDLRAGAAAGTATCFCAWGFGHDDGLAPDLRAASVAELTRLLT